MSSALQIKLLLVLITLLSGLIYYVHHTTEPVRITSKVNIPPAQRETPVASPLPSEDPFMRELREAQKAQLGSDDTYNALRNRFPKKAAK